MQIDEQTSRRRFLRQLGVGLAVGIGAAALPSRATAGAGQCCASTEHCRQDCPGTQKDYWCDCISFFYCTNCRDYQGACFSANC